MRSDVRSSVRLPGGFVCFGLGRVGMPWVTVGGRVWCLRGGSVQFGPEAYVRFVAKTRSLGGNGLFLPFFSGRVRLWFFSVGFEKCIACLRFGNFGGLALAGCGRSGAFGIWGLDCGLGDSTVYVSSGRSVGTGYASGSVGRSCCP